MTPTVTTSGFHSIQILSLQLPFDFLVSFRCAAGNAIGRTQAEVSHRQVQFHAAPHQKFGGEGLLMMHHPIARKS